jgi:hypothetical protein
MCDFFVHNILSLGIIDSCDTVGVVSNAGKTNQVSTLNCMTSICAAASSSA